MAVIAKTETELRVPADRKPAVYTWAALAGGDTGDPLELASTEAADRSIQFVGEFDGATVVLEGSNDGTTWATLTDPQGNAISKAAASLEQVTEVTRWIRPSVTGGGGSEDIDAILLVRR